MRCSITWNVSWNSSLYQYTLAKYVWKIPYNKTSVGAATQGQSHKLLPGHPLEEKLIWKMPRTGQVLGILWDWNFFLCYLEYTCNCAAKCQSWITSWEKKNGIWPTPMTKTLIPTETTNWQHKDATLIIDYTTIADRLRTVIWSNNNNQTGVFKTDNGT